MISYNITSDHKFLFTYPPSSGYASRMPQIHSPFMFDNTLSIYVWQHTLHLCLTTRSPFTFDSTLSVYVWQHALRLRLTTRPFMFDNTPIYVWQHAHLCLTTLSSFTFKNTLSVYVWQHALCLHLTTRSLFTFDNTLSVYIYRCRIIFTIVVTATVRLCTSDSLYCIFTKMQITKEM